MKNTYSKNDIISFAKTISKRQLGYIPDNILIKTNADGFYAEILTQRPCDNPKLQNDCDGKMILRCSPKWGISLVCSKCGA